ncbi:hypothetical protein IQ249_18380 [Lusitaniella coriacea LEGE 07157]|uniref:Uncharacterized protein n=1 Tax=Lusitaniella coriacea LEGE 07157 TaxID=945747 RepID=A0A8J7JD69_9CYAN|nr:hypothetical protein [Lusitaniella coriacea]MBE9117870.1 hypothetical protein [Lusitaniella coriacea LEGE 07157]
MSEYLIDRLQEGHAVMVKDCEIADKPCKLMTNLYLMENEEFMAIVRRTSSSEEFIVIQDSISSLSIGKLRGCGNNHQIEILSLRNLELRLM